MDVYPEWNDPEGGRIYCEHHGIDFRNAVQCGTGTEARVFVYAARIEADIPMWMEGDKRGRHTSEPQYDMSRDKTRKQKSNADKKAITEAAIIEALEILDGGTVGEVAERLDMCREYINATIRRMCVDAKIKPDGTKKVNHRLRTLFRVVREEGEQPQGSG